MEQDNEKIEQRILRAASEVFLERGYTATNMTLIAEKAGIGRPSLYYYYREKDKIFNELFGSFVKRVFPSVVEIIKRDEPIERRLDSFVDNYFSQLQSEPRIPMLILREAYRDPQFLVNNMFDANVISYINEIREAFQDEVEKGTIKNVPPYAIIFTCLGQIVMPMIAKPLVQTVLTGDSSGSWVVAGSFEELMDLWKPYVRQSLRSLLLQ